MNIICLLKLTQSLEAHSVVGTYWSMLYFNLKIKAHREYDKSDKDVDNDNKKTNDGNNDDGNDSSNNETIILTTSLCCRQVQREAS